MRLSPRQGVFPIQSNSQVAKKQVGDSRTLALVEIIHKSRGPQSIIKSNSENWLWLEMETTTEPMGGGEEENFTWPQCFQ